MSGASSCCCGDDGKEGGNIRTTDVKGLPTLPFTFVKDPISEIEYRLWFMGGDVILLTCLLTCLLCLLTCLLACLIALTYLLAYLLTYLHLHIGLIPH